MAERSARSRAVDLRAMRFLAVWDVVLVVAWRYWVQRWLREGGWWGVSLRVCIVAGGLLWNGEGEAGDMDDWDGG